MKLLSKKSRKFTTRIEREAPEGREVVPGTERTHVLSEVKEVDGYTVQLRMETDLRSTLTMEMVVGPPTGDNGPVVTVYLGEVESGLELKWLRKEEENTVFALPSIPCSLEKITIVSMDISGGGAQ